MAYRNFFTHIVTEKQTGNGNMDDEDDSDDENNLNIFHETAPVRRKVKCDITLPIIASTYKLQCSTRRIVFRDCEHKSS